MLQDVLPRFCSCSVSFLCSAWSESTLSRFPTNHQPFFSSSAPPFGWYNVKIYKKNGGEGGESSPLGSRLTGSAAVDCSQSQCACWRYIRRRKVTVYYNIFCVIDGSLRREILWVFRENSLSQVAFLLDCLRKSFWKTKGFHDTVSLKQISGEKNSWYRTEQHFTFEIILTLPVIARERFLIREQIVLFFQWVWRTRGDDRGQADDDRQTRLVSVLIFTYQWLRFIK